MIDDPIVTRFRKRLAEMRAAGASKEEIRDFIEDAKVVLDEVSANDPERQRDVNDTIGAVAQEILQGATFGLEGLVEDALSRGSFRENRDARAANRAALPAYLSIPAGVTGALINPVGSLLGPAKAGAGVLRTLGKGALEGAAQAGITGTAENVGTTADPTGLKSGAMYAAVGAPLGAAGAVYGRRLANSRAASAGFDAPKRRLGEAVDADMAYEVPVFPKGPGAPKPRAFDVAGPTVRAEAKEAARSIPGREAIRKPFEQFEADVPKRIGEGFDAATGTTAKDADDLAREIASLEAARAQANTTQAAIYDDVIAQLKEAHRVAVEEAKRTALPKALNVLEEESGGKIPDAVETLGQLKDARSELAGHNYPNAIEATKGQPVEMTPEAEAFLKTPTGQAAWQFAQRARADIVPSDPSRALPNVRKLSDKAPPGFTMDQVEKIPQLRDALTVEEAVPDAEAWHVMKQYLANAAKLGPDQTTPEGLSAIHAQNALQLHGTALDQQDELFRAADRAYAEQSGEMGAVKLGMAGARGNPPTKSALSRSLTAVEQQADALPPNEADLFKLGRQHAIASMLRAGKRPSSVALLLEEPSSDISRQVVQAYGEGAPQRIAAKLRALEPQKLRLPAKPADMPMAPEVEAAQKGLGITRAPVEELPVLESSLPSFSQGQRRNLQRGAAADFRGELAKGKSLDLGTPDRARRFAFAEAKPGSGKLLGQLEQALQDIVKKQKTVLGGEAPLPDATEGVGELAAKAYTPSLGLTAARMMRQLLSHPFKGRVERLGLEDAAFNRQLLDDPDVLRQALEQLTAVNKRGSELAASSAGRFGRLGAALPSPFTPD